MISIKTTLRRLAIGFALAVGTLPSLTALAAVPTLLGSFDTNGLPNANTVAVSGTYAYIGTDQNNGGPEFYVVDIADPASPSIVGSREIGANVNKVVVSGTLAYLATSHDATELLILNIATPAAPTPVGSGYNATNGANGLALALKDTTVYLGTAANSGGKNHEFYILDVSDVINGGPTWIVTRLGSYNVDADVHALTLNSTDAYLATGHNTKELCILDVANPNNILPKSSYDTPGTADAYGIAYRNSKVYLVTDNGGSSPDFFVFQVQPSLTLLGSANLDAMNTAVAVFRDRAYVTSKTNGKGLMIVAIGNPAQPALLQSYDAPDNELDVLVDGPRTYLASANNTQELQILDTTFLLRPNIVLLYTDDQDMTTLPYMPITQQEVFNQGVQFTESFTTTPICCPSRASLLTGQYAHNTGVQSNFAPTGGATKFVGKDASTIATWLQGAGYRTGIYGKYLNEYNKQCPPYTGSCYVPPGWNEWHVFVNPTYYDYQLTQNNGTTVSYGPNPSDYSTDVLKTKTVEFITSADEQPFFLFVSIFAPHAKPGFLGVPIPAPRHEGSFASLPPWRPANYDEEDVSDKPAWFATYPRANDPLGPITIGMWTDNWRIDAVESLQAADEATGEIIDALEAIGQAQDTMVIFASDNGFSWGSHRIFTEKGCEFDECLRVPLAIRYPRWITTPRTDTHMVLNLDLAPTFAELAATTPASMVNGVSLVPLLKNQSITWRDDFLFEVGDGTTEGSFVGVRNMGWKYVEFPAASPSDAELYNLTYDPSELQSYGYDPSPSYVFLRSIFKNRLEELKNE